MSKIKISEAQLKKVIKESIERVLDGFDEMNQDSRIEDIKELCKSKLSRFGANNTYGYLFDKVLKHLENGEITTIEELEDKVEKYKDWAKRNGMTDMGIAANEILGKIRL